MRLSAKRASGPAAMLLAGALTFFICYVFSLRGVDPQHQGFLLKSAVDVSRGLSLYGETFTQYGSLAVYLLVPGVLLFGETVVAINIMTCLAYALCAMLLSRIVLRYTNAVLALLCPLLAIGLAAFYFWNFHPWPSVFTLLFSLVATDGMIRYVDQKRPVWLIICGAATAAMFWCRQPQGLTAVCGLLLLVGFHAVGFFPDKRTFFRALLLFFLGNLLVHAALFAVLLLQGTLHDWWIQAVQNAFTFAANPTAETAAARPDGLLKILFVGLNGNPRYDFIWRVLTYGALAYFLVLAFTALRRAGTRRRTAPPDCAKLGCIAFAAFALFNWPHYFPTLCYRHVFWCDYPMVGVLGVALYQLFGWLLCRMDRGQRAHSGGTADSNAPTAAGVQSRRRALQITALTCAVLLLLCADNLLLRARIGKSRLLGGGNGAQFHTIEQAEEDTVVYYENADYGYLNGLYLSPRETRFYDGLFDALKRLQAEFPDRNIVNLTPNALFSVFTSDNPHLRPYDDDPRDFGYPEQMDVTMAYIAANKPIVLSHKPLPGYTVSAYLTDFNGDYWRFEPFYVLSPEV